MANFLSFSIRYLLSAVIITLFVSVINLPLGLGETNPPSPPFSKGGNKGGYVGSDACKDCHEKEYNSFMTYAKKSKSFESIERVRKGLTEEEIKGCYFCHTTGYGKPGGFVSPEKTPHLKK